MAILPFVKRRDGAARAPEGRVVYAIGDIHGRADLLARLFDRLEREPPTSAKPIAVFLGDYIDRGPDSAEVVELLQFERPEGFELHYLKGNHEASMLAFLEDPVQHRAWLRHGGLETLASYKIHPLPSQGADNDEIKRAAQKLAQAMPEAHHQFFAGLQRYVVLGDYLFVHAGVDPDRKLDAQNDRDLYWIRHKFLTDRRPYALKVVHGHTPAREPFADHRRVGVDTGAYYSGMLSAARFEDDEVRFISVR